MKKLILFYAILITSSLFAQKSISVLNNTTIPIPYAKVYFEGKNYYRNTDEKGKLKLEKGESISKISAVGFEDLYPQSNQETLVLIAKEQIPMIESPNNKKVIVENEFDGRKTTTFFLPDEKILSTANFFAYKKKYPKIAFIKNISFSSKSRNGKQYILFLKLYRNDNGKPGAVYYESAAIKCSNKLPEKYMLDLSKDNVLLPKEGLFLAIECAMISKDITAPFLQMIATKDDNVWMRTTKWNQPKYPGVSYKLNLQVTLTD